MIKIMEYGKVADSEIFARSTSSMDVSSSVSEIIDKVRKNGDKALIELTKELDGACLNKIEVSKEEIKEAVSTIDSDFLKVLKKARDNIRNYHEKQRRNDYVITEENGVVLGQKSTPVSVAGIYVPGGTAAYPSTVLMDAIPAKIAGCSQVVMVTPPSKDGKISKEVLAAAYVAGVDRIFSIGGAQAIAALAYGTETVPRADKIVGPGNIYVAEAKKQVSGIVSIDMIAGPSEILIIADRVSSSSAVAADMLSQAEHDKNASAVLITDSRHFAYKVCYDLEKQLESLPRKEIARASIDNNGKIIIVSKIEKAIEISNALAPEHLELCVDNPFDYLSLVKNAGSIFLGRSCPEALGDYLAGPNHTLPTSGTARFSSPLSVDDFMKKSQFTYYSEKALKAVAQDVALFARREGLEAHARSALIRLEEEDE